MKAAFTDRVSGLILWIISLFLFQSWYSVNAQMLPGGVFGAEVWYIASDREVSENIFTDHSQYPLLIERCTNEEITSGLLNFNPSVFSESLCLSYRAPLESLYHKNIFVVAEPDDDVSNALFHSNLESFGSYIPPAGVYSENTFIIETHKGYLTGTSPFFESYQNAHVYYYDWNNFDQEKKYKSFGQKGEAIYSIGEPFGIRDIYERDSQFFSGLLPEFIAFNRKLTREEYVRVESYLALKYGITKWHTDAYLSANNIVFWDAENNSLFPNNIFGIGRDDISGLNQLQCESAHKKGYLIAAVERIMETNEKVQTVTSVLDEEFLVFGDNGEKATTPMNSRNLERFNKVWLAQLTGEEIRYKTIHFKLRLDAELDRRTFDKLMRGELSVWMLHDLLADAEEVSDFEGAHIRMYPSSGITQDPDTGDFYAEFELKTLFFDTDKSRFDQFTFGFGSACAVTFATSYDCEKAIEGLDCYKLQIIVAGQCSKVFLYDSQRNEQSMVFDQELSDLNGFPTYLAEVCAPETYMIELFLADGTREVLSYEVFPIGPYRVDLGESVQYLTTEQPEILLDAGMYMPEGSSYSWFKDNHSLAYYESQLLVDQIGKYCVDVISPDGFCTISECIVVDTYLKVEHLCQSNPCDGNGNSIVLNFIDGLPLFEIELISSNGSAFYFTDETTYTITGLSPDFYYIKVIDASGMTFEEFCEFDGVSSTEVILGPDLILSSLQPEYQIDASILVDDPEAATFKWYLGGLLLSHDTSEITVAQPGLYRVEITENNCMTIGIQMVIATLEGQITGTDACDDNEENLIEILIDYGISPYITQIHGIHGTVYSDRIEHGGSIHFYLPNGSYFIATSDSYENILETNFNFEGFISDTLLSQIQAYCDVYRCEYQTNCQIPFYDFTESSLHQIDLQANLVNAPADFSIGWYLNGTFVSNDPQIALIRQRCDDPFPGTCSFMSVTLEINNKECFFTETIYIDSGWCLKSEVPRGYTSKVFPNPAEADVTFSYFIESNSKENFKGKIEVFSVSGALIFSNRIDGDWKYTHTYRLISSGVYLIRTTTEEGVVKADRVIIK